MEFRRMKLEDQEQIIKHALYPVEEKQPPGTVDYDFVLQHGDYILAAGGFRIITNSTAWGWVQLTEYTGKHLVPTYRVIKEWMELFCKENGIHRLQAWVDVRFEQGKRLVEHLGFKKEFKMLDFVGKDLDAWLYIRLMETE